MSGWTQQKFLKPGPSPQGSSRARLGYSFAYGWHCFELYGVRTWLVAFWGFVAASGGAPLGAVVVSALFSAIAAPASILGNELALKLGRHRAITLVMLLSAAVGLAIVDRWVRGERRLAGAVGIDPYDLPARRAQPHQHDRLRRQGSGLGTSAVTAAEHERGDRA